MKSDKRKGFTLIEAVMVMSLVSILALVIGNFIIIAMQSWATFSGRSSAMNMGRSAMNRIVSEIKTMNNSVEANLITYTASECAFNDLSGSLIDFKQVGSSLYRNSDVMATDLTGPAGLQFTYLNSLGSNETTRAKINTVRIRISLLSANQLVTLESSARIRNHL